MLFLAGHHKQQKINKWIRTSKYTIEVMLVSKKDGGYLLLSIQSKIILNIWSSSTTDFIQLFYCASIFSDLYDFFAVET